MIHLREVRLSDVDMIYQWANDPLTRQNSFNSDKIKYDEHVQWFNRMLNRNDVKMYILMEDNKPVGQIRLNINDTNAEISYSIASDFRGMGYGRKIVSLVVDEIKMNIPEVLTVSAQVKPGNSASKSIFEKEGFAMKSVCYELALENTGGETVRKLPSSK